MSGINSLLWVLWYNGYEQQIKDIYEYIKQAEITADYPFDLGILSDDADSPDRILWSVLVMEYGNYGTSPRFGWIKKPQRAIDCFEQFIGECDLYEIRGDEK